MYFWDLNKQALSFTSLFKSALEEFQIDEVVLLLAGVPEFVGTYPEMDFVGY